MTKRTLDWDTIFLTQVEASHSSWRALVGRSHARFAEVAEEDEDVESVGFEHLPAILNNRLTQALQLRRLEERVEDLEERLATLEMEGGAATLYIGTFAPEPYRLMKPIPVSIQRVGESYLASFSDANVNSSGDNQHDAFANVKELVLDTYDRLSSLPAGKLGPGPSRQLAVLREYIDASTIDNEGTC
jgi:hypothetical protein